MRCPDCGSVYTSKDNYCRACGLRLRQSNLPALRERSLPVLWRAIPPSIWRGAALVVASAALELLRREALRRLSAPVEPSGWPTLSNRNERGLDGLARPIISQLDRNRTSPAAAGGELVELLFWRRWSARR